MMDRRAFLAALGLPAAGAEGYRITFTAEPAAGAILERIARPGVGTVRWDMLLPEVTPC